MTKIEKNLDDIPPSLKGGANSKRNGVIANAKFITTKKYRDFYKKKDTTTLLKRIYKNKCAYCEQIVLQDSEQNKTLPNDKSIVEHYRPTSKYYWLAYSWDNLLLSCLACSDNKGNDFEIINQKIEYSNSFKNKIHKSTKLYNRLEKPKMIHPELEDIKDKLDFNRDGVIKSADERVKYTIKTCKLDRYELNEKRQTVLNKLIDDINYVIEQKESMRDVILNFMDKNNDFIAFRIWISKNRKELLRKNG